MVRGFGDMHIKGMHKGTSTGALPAIHKDSKQARAAFNKVSFGE